MRISIICGDFQAPYHDPRATELLMRIGEELQVDDLAINGDFVDWRVMSDHFPIRGERPDLVMTLRDELLTQRGLLIELVQRIKPKRKKFTCGNHEWRLYRALSKQQNVLDLLQIPSIAEKLSVESILGLTELGFECAGEYPNGMWLFEGKPHDRNVWIEHGYFTRKHSGYLATALILDRMTNVVVGHGERLAVKWKRAIGGRRFFGAEQGNLSILAEPAGKGIYSTVPHTAPEFLDHQQGFLVLYTDRFGNFYPVPVAIFNGRAVFNGKEYEV